MSHKVNLHFFLCVEGIGWATDGVDPTNGCDGTVYYHSDPNGDLASTLGCTAAPGLFTPTGISDAFDPRNNSYDPGTMNFRLQDQDGTLAVKLSTAIGPGKTGTLNAELGYNDRDTVQIDNASTTWANADVIWIAQTEAVLLSNKTLSSGTVYDYDTQREYLGTPRGRLDSHIEGTAGLSWPSATKIQDTPTNFVSKKAALYARDHVTGAISTLYTGEIRNISSDVDGIVWTLSTLGNTLAGFNKSSRTSLPAIVFHSRFRQGVTVVGEQSIADRLDILAGGDNEEPETYAERVLNFAFGYTYRNTAGGTKGVRAWYDATPDTTDPQAYTDTVLTIERWARVGSGYYFINYAVTGDHWSRVTTDAVDQITTERTDAPENGSGFIWLVDNYSDSWQSSQFAVEKSVRRNPVDTALVFLTSMPGEPVVDDVASNSATVTINMPTLSVGSYNEHAGSVLHVMEGNSKGESRDIISGTTTTIVVDSVFENTLTSGTEVHVRNSKFDVLPIGFGLGLPAKYLDIDSFEAVRDLYMHDAELGKFATGGLGETNVWDLVSENIFQPYGILPRVSKATGKIEAKIINESLAQDQGDTYDHDIAATDMLSLSIVSINPRPPIGAIEIEARGTFTKDVYVVTQSIPLRGGGSYTGTRREERTVSDPSIVDGQTATVTIKDDRDIKQPYGGNTEILKVKALLNTTDNVGWLVTKMRGKLFQESLPPPETTIKLTSDWILSVQAGDVLRINDTTLRKPINPFTGANGWANVHARVLSTSISFDGEIGISCRVALYDVPSQSKVAPAANIASIATDTFTVNNFDITSDHNYPDYTGFAVDDRIDHVSKSASIHTASYTILAITPGASTTTIQVDSTVSVGFTAGDYVRFTGWLVGTTTNMMEYAAYARAATVAYKDSSAAKVYK